MYALLLSCILYQIFISLWVLQSYKFDVIAKRRNKFEMKCMEGSDLIEKLLKIYILLTIIRIHNILTTKNLTCFGAFTYF